MRIACLQFAPQVGDVDNNLNRADAVLSRANPKNLDLLVLPELAFSGYNFKSLQHISPFLEPTTAGITSLWARTTALKYNCMVTVGYPEKVDVNPKWPTSPEYYNSAITVNAEGETIANYRKSFLYYTDETWALEGPDGFYAGEIEGFGKVAMGICMDLNPYKFEAPWNAWEFSYHVLHRRANLVILSMAWLTREDARSYSRAPKEPDMDTLSYWLSRLEPIIRAETVGEIIVVMANRTGTEDDATYAGTSAVLGIQDGEVKVYGILGRGERDLLVVDTGKKPQARLVSEPNSAVSNASHVSEPSPSIFSEPSRNSGITVDTNLSSPAYARGVSQETSSINSPLNAASIAPALESSPIVVDPPPRQDGKHSTVDARPRSRTRRRKVMKKTSDSTSDRESRSSSMDAVAGDDVRSIADSTTDKRETFQGLLPDDPQIHDRLKRNKDPSLPPRRGPDLPLNTKSLSEAVLEPSNRFASPRSEFGGTPIFTDSPLFPTPITPMLGHDLSHPVKSIVPEGVQSYQPAPSSDLLQNDNTSVPVLEVDNSQKRHPLSALAIPESYQTSGTTSSFGPRSAHTPSRPKSNVW